MSRRVAAGALAALAILSSGPPAQAEDPRPPAFTDAEVLDKPAPYFRVESLSLRYTHFDQTGTGYQSRRGPRGGPGLETMSAEQPQLEVVVKQGDRITHRIWAPVDVVTAASPDAIDVVSSASRSNEAGAFDWTATYKASPEASLSIRNGIHNEENFRSWNSGFGVVRSFAEENTVLEASVNQLMDWFDGYTLAGGHDGHRSRTSTNLNAGLSQILSPTTIAHLDYGLTLQRGQLSNGWNIVPLTTGDVALEILPKTRVRHALVGRLAQFLPWDGAAHAFYRFYVDDWGIRAHTVELELYQRLARVAYARLSYRFHRQTGASFFHTQVDPTFKLATADSDLAALDAQTVGFKLTVDAPPRFAKNVRFDLAAERYFRSNDLRVNVFSCGLGFLF
jgi:hypothetical protein